VRSRSKLFLTALPLVATGLLALRLLVRVRRYSVDLLFWDQWDFLEPLFAGQPWLLFERQHGPHRLGLGGLLEALVANLSGWSTRAETFVAVAIVLGAALLGLWLVRRLAGSSKWDVLVPIILLGGLHADAICGTPNLSHPTVPFLLALSLPLAATAGPRVRLPALLALDLAALFTGFAFVAAPLVRLLLLVWTFEAFRERRGRLAVVASLAISTASLALFLRGYVSAPAAACFAFPHPRPLEYAPFAAAVLARPWGISGPTGWRLPIVTLLAAPVVAVFGWALLRTARRLWREPAGLAERPPPSPESRLATAVLLLSGFSTLFAAITAVGRLCLGAEAAAATRYVPYALPGVLAVYLFLRGQGRAAGAGSEGKAAPGPRFAQARFPLALYPLALMLVVKEGLVSARPVRETVELADDKRRWQACYLARRDLEACSAQTGFAVHPWPKESRVAAKLRFLEARRLSLFRGR